MRKVFFLIAALVSVAVFSSCAKKADASAFVGKRLEAVSLYGKSVDQKAMMKGVFMVLDTANKVNGAAGCNNFFGGYETEGDMIKFGAAGMTRMMCDPLSMEAESQMVKLMGEADRFAVDGTTVTFYKGEEAIGVFAVKECCKAECRKACDKPCPKPCVKDSAACAKAKCCKADSAVCAKKPCCKAGERVCLKDSAKCCKAKAACVKAGEKPCRKANAEVK